MILQPGDYNGKKTVFRWQCVDLWNEKDEGFDCISQTMIQWNQILLSFKFEHRQKANELEPGILNAAVSTLITFIIHALCDSFKIE